MAFRVFTRRPGAPFVASGVLANHGAVRDAIQTALLDPAVTDCIAEDDAQTIFANRWFIVFQGRRGMLISE